MGKAHYRTPKKQGGLSLVPELWERIDEAARRAGVTRNRVIETLLMREFELDHDLQNQHVNKRHTKGAARAQTVQFEAIDDDDNH